MTAIQRPINHIRAQGSAWRLTQEYCLDTPGPVPVEDIAMDQGVICVQSNLTGCLARLVRKKNRGIIRTHEGIKEAGRRRFAVAHELGHWFLHEAEPQLFVCTAEDMRDYKGSPVEVEANVFASELLMPTCLFRPLAEKADPRLETVAGLARLFETSLTATAMRFIDANQHECILVASMNGRVAWSKQSGNRSGLRIEKGVPLHSRSLAFHSAASDSQLGPEVVPVEAWIAENWHGRSIELTEECWRFQGYNSTLSLLVITDTDPTEDDAVTRFEGRNKSC